METWNRLMAVRGEKGVETGRKQVKGVAKGHTSSVQKHMVLSGHVVGKIETFIEEDTRYMKHCT